MKFCTADAGILLVLASLFTSISTIFAQSDLNDSLQLSSKGLHQTFDFENVANRLSKLSDISMPMVEVGSLGQRISTTVVRDLTNTHGHVDLTYAYGLNTVFLDTSRSIGSIFNTFGEFSTAIVGLPINFSFNYSSLRVPLGTNNYFRFSLDKDRLVKQQKEKLTGSITELEKKQAILDGKRSELTGLMGYVEVQLDQLKRLAARQVSRQKQTANERMRDSIAGHKPQLSDSLVQNPIDYQLYYDSVMKMYSRITALQQRIDSISTTISAAKQKLGSYQTLLETPAIPKTGFNKFNLLQSIRTFDLGLTYPRSTGMSDQNVPIKGVNVEIQHKKYYLSVASGLTLNNLMLSTNEVHNKLNYSQNVFNNFDFQQVLQNGWLTVIKTGYGTPDGSHAFLGFNYLSNTRFPDPSASNTQTPYDPAASVELDLRYVPEFLKGSAFDLVYGKTSSNKRLDSVSDMGVFQSIFSTYQSNLFLGRYSQSISKLRSDFSVSYRRIDPFANPTVFGMLQPNNQRMEINTGHRLAKFMKLGLLYRREQTIRTISGMNGLQLNVLGANISGSHTSYFNYAFFVNHIHHKMSASSLAATVTGNNYLIGASAGSNYTIGVIKANSVLAYNDYLITDTSGINKYTQFGLVQSFSEKKYQISTSYDYFFKRINGNTSGTSVFGLSGKYAFSKVKLSVGLKLASDFLAATSLGGHTEVIWQINNYFDVSARGERFVLGDFYRSYYRNQYEQFPYLFTVQTRFKI